MTQPLIIETHDVNDEIKNYVMANKLGMSTVDYNILTVRTVISHSNTEETVDYIDNPVDKDIFSVELLRDENISIDQYYEIEIFEKEYLPSSIIPKYSIVSTKSKCSMYLVIPKNQTIVYTDNLLELFKLDIRKKMIKLGLLIGVFDEGAHVLDGLVAKVRVHGEVRIENDLKMLLMKSVEPIPQIDGELDRLYNHKQDVNDANRGFVIDVKENEVIMIYKKPTIGFNGRDCFGGIIVTPKPSDKNRCSKKIGNGIRLEESDEDIKIIATKSGYFNDTINEISVKNELDVQSITFRKTGSVESDLDANIKINVTETNYLNDAIDAVGVDTKDINIQGNVGHNATIVAETVEISGQVHISSEIKADKIKIHRLKGVATGKTVDIDILEQGRIKGETIKIGVANGGLIIGENVYVDVVHGSTIIFASKTIEVKKILGEDNKFYMDPFATKNSYEIREKVAKRDALEVDIKKLLLQKAEYTKQMRNQVGPIKEIRKKMEELKTKNISLPLSMQTAYNKYKELAILVKELQRTEFLKQVALTTITDYLSVISHSISEGTIITHNPWSEHNKIVFKISPGREMEYKPKLNEELYRIQVVDEENNDIYKFVMDKDKPSDIK